MAILRVGGSGSPLARCGYRFAGRGSMLAGQSQIYAGRLEIVKNAGARCGLRVARCELRLPNVEGLGNSLAYAYGDPWRTFVTHLS